MKKAYESPQIEIIVIDNKITLNMSEQASSDLITCYSVDPDE